MVKRACGPAGRKSGRGVLVLKANNVRKGSEAEINPSESCTVFGASPSRKRNPSGGASKWGSGRGIARAIGGGGVDR